VNDKRYSLGALTARPFFLSEYIIYIHHNGWIWSEPQQNG